MSPSFGFLFGVLLLLETLDVALCHGVNDGQNKIEHHDQHHFLKYPREPAFSLQRTKQIIDVYLYIIIKMNIWATLNVFHIFRVKEYPLKKNRIT